MEERDGDETDGCNDADLVGLIYRAAAGLVTWQRFLKALARRYAAHGATLFEQSFVHSNVRTLGTIGIDASMQAAYAQHYARSNPWVLAQQGMGAGTVVLSQSLVPPEVLNRNECFQEWHHPQDFDFAVGSSIAVTDRSSLKLGVLRSHIAGPMDQTHAAHLRTLMPHLQHALKLDEQRRRLEIQAGAFAALGACTSIAALVLSESRHVIEMNSEAQAIIGRRDGFFLDNRSRLRVRDPKEEVALIELLRQAVAGESIDQHKWLSITVSRMRGVRPYCAEAMRLGARPPPGRHGDDDDDGGAGVLLCIRDPERTFASDPEILQRTLCLTPAEARLAACLAQGLSLREAAGKLRIAESTARFVVKRVLSKTDCHRQADLIRVVLASSR